MAVIKCKMCGGDLNTIEDSTVCECEYCGTKQTAPKVDDEKKLKLFSRAGKLLRNCEFDKAAGVFESIVADFPEEAEAYWGLSSRFLSATRPMPKLRQQSNAVFWLWKTANGTRQSNTLIRRWRWMQSARRPISVLHW